MNSLDEFFQLVYTTCTVLIPSVEVFSKMPALQLDRMSEFEDRLRRSGFQQLEPFFVLREGHIQDERNGAVLKLDKSRLEKIAAIQNQRIATSGDATPIIIGHTKKGKKENEQPELTGWATRFDVVPFYDTNTYGLRAVPWSRPEKIDNFERYPRRSAELWTNPDLLDPISLLGSNTPRLDLGVHRLSRAVDVEYYVPRYERNDTPIHLEMDTTMPENQDPASAPAPAGGGGGGGGGPSSACAEVFNSPEWKQMQQSIAEFSEIASVIKPLIQEMAAGGGPEGGGAPPPGAGAPPVAGPAPAPTPGSPNQMSGHPVPPVPAGPSAPPHQMNYGGGSPAGGMNSQIPHQMQRDQSYDPRDHQIAGLRQQVEAMQLSMVSNTINSLLDDLEDKIVIDRARDFSKLVQLSRADLDAEIQFMLATRKPVTPAVPPEALPLHLQALGNQQGAARGPMGPVQLTMTQAHDMLAMGGDPTAVPDGVPGNYYDAAVEAIRNRGRGEGADALRERIMGRLSPKTNGVPVRG